MGRRDAVAGLVLVAALVGAPGAWAREAPGTLPPPTDPASETLAAAEAAAEAARGRLAAAEQVLARATRTSGAATARVARAEEALVAPVVARREARQRAVLATAAVDAAERVAADRVEALAAELDRLAFQAHRAYKYGSGFAGAMALEVVRHASSPNELSRNLHDLSSVVGYQQGEVREAEEMLARAVQAVAEVRLVRDRAVVRAATLDREVEAAEDEVTRLRRRADEAEARWLRVAGEVLRREGELAAATAEVAGLRGASAEAVAPPAPPTPPTPPTPAEDEPPTLEERQRYLRNRAAALGRARALDPVLRRTRDDLVCPVDGGTFADDWHFPRSHERRHEGTDVFAARGTPVRAVGDGVVTEVDRVDGFDGDHDLGGLTVTYATGPTERWYAAHLDEVRADLVPGMQLTAGEVVGWVGTSGNAVGTPPHLHLGWYVEDTAVNPYASLAVACGGT